jgi:hypothetical protein
MKPTAPNLAKFYDVHFNTIHNWKKKKPVLYKAMVDYFMKNTEGNYYE